MGKGVCLNSLAGPNLLKEPSQNPSNIKPCFPCLLNKLVNTLKFTFPCAVDQRQHKCLPRLISESFIMYIKPLSSLRWVQTSLFSAYNGMKASAVIEAQHREEMADVNFLRFSFFANTSLGYYKSGHVGEGLAAAFIHTCSGRAQKIPFSMATLDPRGGEARFYRRTHWSPGCEELMVAGRLAGWPAVTHLHLSASGLLVNNAQKKRHFSPSPGMNGAGSKAECLEALIHLPAVGLYARPRTIQFIQPQS